MAFTNAISELPDPLTLENIKNMPEHFQRCIKAIRVKPNGEVQLVFHDKLKALEKIGDYLGMWEGVGRKDGLGSTPCLGGLEMLMPPNGNQDA